MVQFYFFLHFWASARSRNSMTERSIMHRRRELSAKVAQFFQVRKSGRPGRCLCGRLFGIGEVDEGFIPRKSLGLWVSPPLRQRKPRGWGTPCRGNRRIQKRCVGHAPTEDPFDAFLPHLFEIWDTPISGCGPPTVQIGSSFPIYTRPPCLAIRRMAARFTSFGKMKSSPQRIGVTSRYTCRPSIP